VILVQSFWNYSYYNKETKSVYVMKRLPDRKEYSRTIWVAPVMEAVIIALIMTGNILVDLGIYAFFTPDIALPADYLSHILPF
jgi:preprotein translocase subunit Sss1